MAETRCICARATAVLVGLLLGPGWVAAREPLVDAPPVWHENDRTPIARPAERDLSQFEDAWQEGFRRPTGRATNPDRILRGVPRAANVNSLGEVPNSSWFTNRIGLFAMTPEDVARGPGTGSGPDRSRPWTVIAAKTEGVTPGFTIEDVRGDRYLIKFDPPGFPGTTVPAGVVANRIFHACGYNVPEDAVVVFDREMLEPGQGAQVKGEGGSVTPLTHAELEEILERVDRLRDGRWRALASKFLEGTPVGPFPYQGTRKDDPNDTVPHQHRRELRGLRVVAAWVNHFDAKQGNTLDMYVGEDGEGHLRHHLIDFASTLGCGGRGLNPRLGLEYDVDAARISGRVLTLGLRESEWWRLSRPEGLEEVCFFESAAFRPRKWKPQYANTPFDHMTDEDGYWAAKIVSAFTEPHIAGAVWQGRYENQEAAAYLARTLVERRNKIARAYFDRIPPLDFFRVEGDTVCFQDLGEERGVYPGTTPRYRFRVSVVSADRKSAGWSEWTDLFIPRIPLDPPQAPSPPASGFPFTAIECQVDRGEGWSGSVTAYLSRASRRVIAVDR